MVDILKEKENEKQRKHRNRQRLNRLAGHKHIHRQNQEKIRLAQMELEMKLREQMKKQHEHDEITPMERGLLRVQELLESGQQMMGASITGGPLFAAKEEKENQRKEKIINQQNGGEIGEKDELTQSAQAPHMQEAPPYICPKHVKKNKTEKEWAEDRRDNLIRLSSLMVCIFVVLLALGGMAIISWQTSGHWYSPLMQHQGIL